MDPTNRPNLFNFPTLSVGNGQGTDGDFVNIYEKPVELAKAWFSVFVEPGDRILITHAGFAFAGIAAVQLGTILEIDPRQFSCMPAEV